MSDDTRAAQAEHKVLLDLGTFGERSWNERTKVDLVRLAFAFAGHLIVEVAAVADAVTTGAADIVSALDQITNKLDRIGDATAYGSYGADGRKGM